MAWKPLRDWEAGVAVRRDWPDRTHEFVHFGDLVNGSEGEARAGANRFIDADRAYWRRGPWRPTHELVMISLRDFELHRSRPDCRAPDCPSLH
jgi:hypothetical protein